MTDKQRLIANALENLVGKRFNKQSLEKDLSQIFAEDIKIELGCQDVDYLADWDFMFCSENADYGGDFDIYVLYHRNKDTFGNTFYVTEVSYDFL